MRQIREFKNIHNYCQLLKAIVAEKIKPGVTKTLVDCGALDHLIDPSYNDRVTFAAEIDLFFTLTQKRQVEILEYMTQFDNGNIFRKAIWEWYIKNSKKLHNERLATMIDDIVNMKIE